jgi:glycosyltransferase involved in cell wall biosynthesis
MNSKPIYPAYAQCRKPRNNVLRATLLDVTRSLSRVGQGPATGIDRVEAAYIRHFLSLDGPRFFIARVAGGFVLLDRDGMAKLNPIVQGNIQPGRRDFRSMFYRRINAMAARAQSDARRLSFARCPHAGLAAMLARHIPKDFAYLNIGHSNRKPELWAAIRAGGAGKVFAMLHDTIPLDWPQYSREGLAERFAEELKATIAASDAIICNSQDTKASVQRWAQRWEMVADLRVILLGCDPLPRPPAEPVATQNPEFVVLGTIEPRKNHALLLDVWAQLADAATAPQLHIIGRRGWLNAAVFARLDNDPMMGRSVFEHGALDDKALGHRLARARALLFPSFAEGYGYPLVEALQMGIPVICSDLPVFRELAGSAATYLPTDDPDAWLDAIRKYSLIRPQPPAKIDFPSWDSHFSIIDDYCSQ